MSIYKNINPNMNTVWNIEQAQKLCANLERQLASLGAHVALGGSVLYNGSSVKDVDIIIYPHSSVGSVDSLTPIMARLLELGFTYSCDEPSTKDGKVIRVMNDISGRRVDFFFFQYV